MIKLVLYNFFKKMIADNLPKKIPIFPLSDVVFFPKTILPLNIFETRYIQLVINCMKDNKLFGMVQPKLKTKLKTEVYNVGCLGKIISFEETADKRFIINLSGIIRFKIEKELKTDKLYREFEVDYSSFSNDLKKKEKKDFESNSLIEKIKFLFNKKNYFVNFEELKKLDFDQLLNTICMVSPFSIEEKQKLIETAKTEDRLKLLEKIINFNLIDNFENKTIQ